MTATAPLKVEPETAAAGWGVAFRFDGKDALLHGAVAIEFTTNPPTARLVRVVVSPVPRYLTDINLDRPWAEIIYLIVKKTLEPKQLAGDIMTPLANEIRRAAAEPAWYDAMHAWGESGQTDALRAEVLRVLRSVVDTRFDLNVRYFPSLDESTMQRGALGATDAGGTVAQTVTVTPQSDPVRGVMVSALQPGDEIFVKLTDDSPLAVGVRTQLGGADEEGNLRAVARPFREARATDDRGNYALYVELTDGVVGVADVYRSVKVKTMRGLLQAAAPPAASAGDDDDAFAEAPSLGPWVMVIAAALVLTAAAWLLKGML
ncbi:MAG TPA: hypothetical protein PKM88_14525 [bacterium]|nr:hypothetical protein [bacterium]